jgi:hypothetical protein
MAERFCWDFSFVAVLFIETAFSLRRVRAGILLFEWHLLYEKIVSGSVIIRVEFVLQGTTHKSVVILPYCKKLHNLWSSQLD